MHLQGFAPIRNTQMWLPAKVASMHGSFLNLTINAVTKSVRLIELTTGFYIF